MIRALLKNNSRVQQNTRRFPKHRRKLSSDNASVEDPGWPTWMLVAGGVLGTTMPPWCFVYLLETDTGVRYFFDQHLPAVVPFISQKYRQLASPYRPVEVRGEGILTDEKYQLQVTLNNGVTYEIEAQSMDGSSEVRDALIKKGAPSDLQVVDIRIADPSAITGRY